MAKNFAASYSSCITTNTHDDDDDHVTNTKLTRKRKRDHALGRKRRNNNWGKLTSHSSSYLFNPYHHDTNDVCLCLSLSCRLRAATTTHDHETSNKKKKTCNDDAAAVGKHNNLQLLQPVHDSTVCLHLSLASPSCSCCDQISKKQKLRVQETKTKAKKRKLGDQETKTKAKKQKLGDQETKIKKTSCNAVDDQQWEIKKVLQKSDICTNARRLLLNMELAEQFVIPHLLGGAEAALKGVQVQVLDIDTNSSHSLVFKIWTSAKSHVFIETWIEDFVQRRNLKKGDQIGLRWDQVNNCFDFSVLQQSI